MSIELNRSRVMDMFWLKVVISGATLIGAAAFTVKVVRCPECDSFHTHKEKELCSEYNAMYRQMPFSGLHTFEDHFRKCDDCGHRYHLHRRYMGKGHLSEYKRAA